LKNFVKILWQSWRFLQSVVDFLELESSNHQCVLRDLGGILSMSLISSWNSVKQRHENGGCPVPWSVTKTKNEELISIELLFDLLVVKTRVTNPSYGKPLRMAAAGNMYKLLKS